jgi:DMSO/TMAO reductase YedYZ molybdopterin-dependent catalytic subunit
MALLGYLSARIPSPWARRLVFAPLAVLLVLVAATSPSALSVADAGMSAVVLLAGGLFYEHMLTRLAAAVGAAAPVSPISWLDQPGTIGRREAIVHGLGIGVSVLVFGSAGGWLLRRANVRQPPTFAGHDLTEVRALLLPATAAAANDTDGLSAASDATTDGFDTPPDLRARSTPIDRFYVVDAAVRDPRIVESDWTLRVHGAVERELRLTYADLLALPAVELDGTLMCISFEYENNLISTTRWTGVPLHEILRLAGPLPSAIDVALHGSGGYSDSIPLAKALEPTTLAAYGMGGKALTHRHGFPCRVYVPNLYGIKNVKWLREIELVSYDYRGFWQERAWTDTAEVNTISMIDAPWQEAVRDEDSAVWVAGMAFAGARGIRSVELSVDDGPWLPVDLEPYVPALVWQRWRHQWGPDAGTHTLTVRAVDLAGEPQITASQPPHPDGLTGLDRVEVRIL